MHSCIRWAGSKRLLIPRLSAAYPASSHRYVEPFAGSAALFFHLEPERALLSDLNSELMATYRALKADVRLVLDGFDRIPKTKASYLRQRSLDPTILPESSRAARFLFLNRYCFNGLYRTNLAGDFNVPYGPPKHPLSRFHDRVLHVASALQRATLKTQDFASTVTEVRKGDFVYLDPPYATDDRRIFREYLPGSFARRDLSRLMLTLTTIHRTGATFLLSYAATPEAKLLTRGWFHARIRTRRHVAGFGDARRSATEVLISNRPLS